MSNQQSLNRPIRVVMFGSGPELNSDAKQFLCRLDEHPEIEFLAAFCQAESQSVSAVFRDLWKRRTTLAFPLFALWILNKTFHFLLHPRAEIALRKKVRSISGQIHFVKNIHAPEILHQVTDLHPDLGLIYGSPILKPELFEIPPMGTLGIHHGKVPEYRGNKTPFWMMYNGEPCAGVTIQKINQGLDTGSIVKTGAVKAYRRAYRTVVRELEALGLDLYIQAILDVKHGAAKYQPQAGHKGKLYRNPKPMDFVRFWGKQLRRRLNIHE